LKWPAPLVFLVEQQDYFWRRASKKATPTSNPKGTSKKGRYNRATSTVSMMSIIVILH
jgi:hypothetical protein